MQPLIAFDTVALASLGHTDYVHGKKKKYIKTWINKSREKK